MKHKIRLVLMFVSRTSNEFHVHELEAPDRTVWDIRDKKVVTHSQSIGRPSISISNGYIPGISYDAGLWINTEKLDYVYWIQDVYREPLKTSVLEFNQAFTNNTLTMEDVILYET